jgi:hypothetical protein
MTGTLFGHARGHWRAQLRFDAPTQGSEGMTMADRTGGLKLVGFIFATVTVAVMLTATMVVKGAPRSAWSEAPMASKP